MSIVNINYRGLVPKSCVDKIELVKKRPPQMLTYKSENGASLLVFASGKCRIMGCKKPIISTINMFPIPFNIKCIQSATACFSLGYTLNLIKLAQQIGPQDCLFEPELFPALRVTKKFNPLCVNVFASGKVTILGLKTLHINKICNQIKYFIDKKL